ncbi:DUF1684 domain-containing protein [Halostella salina]|uniref:DUF1684 domain-containing protein n=1 Tax=Halostella salina TaxID=1547897 RepID=UPI000EF76FB2|nr:DUF1684 domain-containing protein [Halostella salina]
MTDSFDADTWRRELETQREEKDRFFDEHRQSPIPPEERDDFDGLDYFDPDPDYRVTATVTVHDDPEAVTMDTTAGTEVRYRRELTLSFDIDGVEQELAAYRQEGDEQYFVPIRDKTTGQESYEGGRYMEFASDEELDDGDEMVLDFNLAYSPFCAYSETFACPLPPEENWLDVAVEAGEKAP